MRKAQTLKGKRSVIRSFSFFLGASSQCVVMLLAFQARAAAQDYKGKTFVVMVASNPGGGTDTTARLIFRFWPKYLPGTPKSYMFTGPTRSSKNFSARLLILLKGPSSSPYSHL